jgi:hypothetical protein
MNKWLRRLGIGGRRDKVESDVERLAQGGEFHVKQPDEAEAQASFSPDEPPVVSPREPAESPEIPASDEVADDVVTQPEAAAEAPADEAASEAEHAAVT